MGMGKGFFLDWSKDNPILYHGVRENKPNLEGNLWVDDVSGDPDADLARAVEESQLKGVDALDYYDPATKSIKPKDASRTYSRARQREYPSVGDMIDALVKKEAGDSTEWEALHSQRQAIKAKYPKT